MPTVLLVASRIRRMAMTPMRKSGPDTGLARASLTEISS